MAFDNSYTMRASIAIIVKTTPLRKSLLWLLNSVEMSLSNVGYRFYIADEQPLDSWKHDLYAKLKNKGHYIRLFEKPIAVTVARNHLISQLQDEKYVLRVDDDFELGGEFNIDAMLAVLQQEEIDFCCDMERQIGEGKGTKSGGTRIEAGHIVFKKTKRPEITFVNDFSWKYESFNDVCFAKADYMRNLILIKRKVFERVRWNENLLFTGEHVDFFLDLKQAGFQGAFTPDSIHLHRDDLKRNAIDPEAERDWRNIECKTLRNKVFDKKWGGMPKTRRSIVDRVRRKIGRML